MKQTFISFLALMLSVAAMATPVSKQTTLSIANSFFTEMGGSGSLAEVQTEFTNLRIYTATDGGGFVIISSDDAATPLLGYSVTNLFDATNIPANVAAWLQSYDDQIAYIQENGLEATAKIRDAWEHLAKMHSPKRKPASTSDFNTDNLLTTTWSQETYYNNMCPYDQDADKRVPTGCVATAMGQILKYWNFPQNGVGSHSYEHPKYGTLSADFSTANYDWADMPGSLDHYSTSTQVSAVSQLLYHCGVAVDMRYRTDASGAYNVGDGSLEYPCAENAFRKYFKYMHTLHSVCRDNYEDSVWCALLKNEIDNGHPVLYDGADANGQSGHSFVCCGYDNFGLFYFNWGWGGQDDGPYAIDYLNPGLSGELHHYNTAVIGICPDTTGSTTTVISLARNIQNAGSETGAGTYTSYQDTVQILATAAAGYLFDNWNGTMTYNPYSFIANGGNVTHTANYHLLTGDQLGYCNINIFKGAYGAPSPATHYWGIRLDTLSLSPNSELDSVYFVARNSGTYTFHIYEGGETKPLRELKVASGYCSDVDNDWCCFVLDTPVIVDNHKSLWIVLETNDVDSPMVAAQYCGNIDGAWYTDDPQGTWSNYVTDQSEYVSWYIYGFFSECAEPSAVDNVEQSSCLVAVNNGMIMVQNANGESIQIFDATGKLISQRDNTSATELFNVTPGVYFVQIASQTTTVVVNR